MPKMRLRQRAAAAAAIALADPVYPSLDGQGRVKRKVRRKTKLTDAFWAQPIAKIIEQLLPTLRPEWPRYMPKEAKRYAEELMLHACVCSLANPVNCNPLKNPEGEGGTPKTLHNLADAFGPILRLLSMIHGRTIGILFIEGTQLVTSANPKDEGMDPELIRMFGDTAEIIQKHAPALKKVGATLTVFSKKFGDVLLQEQYQLVGEWLRTCGHACIWRGWKKKKTVFNPADYTTEELSRFGRKGYERSLGKLTSEQHRGNYDKGLGSRTKEQHSADSGAIPLIAQKRFEVANGRTGPGARYKRIKGKLPPPIFCESSYHATMLLGVDSARVSDNVNHKIPHVGGYVFERATQEQVDVRRGSRRR
jgi:hypothetical protein